LPRLTVNGASLHYDVVGRGSPGFVFVHGGCCAASDWDAQVAVLSQRFAVLTMDLRGHGRSDGPDTDLTVPRWAADVNELVAASEIGRAVIVGHSLGARIAAEAVAQRPQLYAGLVLLDGSRTIGGLSVTGPGSGSDEAQSAGGTLDQILSRTIGPYADEAVRSRVIRTMSTAPAPVMSACVTALEDWDRDRADTVYSALDLPVLAIQSTYHDRFTPRRSFEDTAESSPYLDSLRGQISSLAVEVMPRTGHFSMMERPEETSALVQRFGAAVVQR
jgi:3-oxoadipate enol-lactonase